MALDHPRPSPSAPTENELVDEMLGERHLQLEKATWKYEYVTHCLADRRLTASVSEVGNQSGMGRPYFKVCLLSVSVLRQHESPLLIANHDERRHNLFIFVVAWQTPFILSTPPTRLSWLITSTLNLRSTVRESSVGIRQVMTKSSICQ